MNTIINAILCFSIGLVVGSYYYHYSPFHGSVSYATAVIHPTKDNIANGTVTFTQEQLGTRVVAQFKELTPGEHGLHIHTFGDCSSHDALCAGDHFNPTKQPHGGPMSNKRHIGDLGNIVANEDGVATYEYVDTHISLNGPHSIIGRSVIVHADKDDFVTQPTGNAGTRVGCGVIGIAKNQ